MLRLKISPFRMDTGWAKETLWRPAFTRAMDQLRFRSCAARGKTQNRTINTDIREDFSFIG
jgi:hypothetical protein